MFGFFYDGLLVSWFRRERKADDVKILFSRYTMNEDSSNYHWTKPSLLADTPSYPDCNPVLFYEESKGNLWLFWSVILSNEWGSSLLKYRRSNNFNENNISWDYQDVINVTPPNFCEKYLNQLLHMATEISLFIPKIKGEIQYKRLHFNIIVIFSSVLCILSAIIFLLIKYYKKKKRLCQKIMVGFLLVILCGITSGYYQFNNFLNDKQQNRLGWLTRCKPLVLDNGKILLPLYSDAYSISLLAISSDKGKSWVISEPIMSIGVVQPSLIQKKNGDILALMRDNGYYGRIRISESKDEGLSWSEVRSMDFLNPGASIDILKLKNGSWVLVYNDLIKGRHQLKVIISEDEGKTWKWSRYLEKGIPHKNRFSYPSLTESKNGIIHCVYSYHTTKGESIKHTQFTADWIKNGTHLLPLQKSGN